MRNKEILLTEIFNDKKTKKVKEAIKQHRLKQREIGLLKLGFEKNEHQQTWISFKYDKNYYVDFNKVLEYDNNRWIDFIESIKNSYIRAKNSIEQSGNYVLGFNSAEKQNKKKLKDKYNHLNSLLRDEKYIKLTKTLNIEKINKLEIEVNLLKELIDDKYRISRKRVKV